MSEIEALETAAIDSVLGLRMNLDRWRKRPFRSPHHTASAPAIVGGGPGPHPGEISRAHNGVLFLDELPQFNRNVLEVLREPLETCSITISRALRQAEFPADVQLVCAMNPCPCGYLGDKTGDCSCSADRVARYRGKISGPLLDRIDLQIEVGRPPKEVLRAGAEPGESSSDVAARVLQARERQLERSGVCNARLEGKAMERHCSMTPSCLALLEEAVDKFNLSARAYQRVLRVSRTIADLAGEPDIMPPHIAEALSLRALDKRRLL
jgi:magnesium chelatase family protein